MSAGVEGAGLDVLDSQDRARFEQLVLPHLDAAFNLSRWLMRGRADAEDVAQEAMLRALRFFRGFHGGDARAWLLQIVRNTCYTWLEKNRSVDLTTEFDEELHPQPSTTPEALAIAGDADRIGPDLGRLLSFVFDDEIFSTGRVVHQFQQRAGLFGVHINIGLT